MVNARRAPVERLDITRRANMVRGTGFVGCDGGWDEVMTLRLYNTLTRRKDVFKPFDPANVRFYACGPTVYDRLHIGNGRMLIVFDVLFRLLRHAFGPDHVTYVRNITDVDDKINARAAERGVPIGVLTEEMTAKFHEDARALGCLDPTIEPRATAHIAPMIAMVERLVSRGHAYAAEGHVLFNVPSMPDYGALSNRSTEDMIAGARVEVAPYKRDPTDFVLWKPSAPGEPGWPSPWGRGRPGWHLECSAMSWQHLGETFDIHGGGIDLLFPHHENEVAQSRCTFGHDLMAQVWMHNGHLQVEGEKMSKSFGNFVTIHDLWAEKAFGGRAWSGDVLRLAMVRTHYRQPIDFTLRALEEAERTLDDFGKACVDAEAGPASEAFVEAIADDLNTPRALAELHTLRAADPGALRGSLALLGITDFAAPRPDQSMAPELEALLARRKAARAAKDWGEADRIRGELAALGISVKDNRDGSVSWERKP